MFTKQIHFNTNPPRLKRCCKNRLPETIILEVRAVSNLRLYGKQYILSATRLTHNAAHCCDAVNCVNYGRLKFRICDLTHKDKVKV